MKYWFENRILDEDNLGEWFCAKNSDVIFFHSFATDELKVISKFSCDIEKNDLFWKEIKFGNIIYFPHRYEGKITRFDIEQQTFLRDLIIEEVDELIKKNKEAYPLGFNSALYGERLFFQSRSFPLVVILDSDSDKYEIIYNTEEESTYWLGTNYVIEREILLTPRFDCNGITILNMEEKNSSTMYIGNSDERFFSMAIDDEGRHYVLEGTKSKLYELDIKRGEITFLADVPGMNCTVHQPFTMIYYADCIYIVPLFDWFGNSIKTWVYNLKTHEIISRDSFGEYESDNKFLVFESNGKVGYFFIPHEEDNNTSGNIKYIEFDYVSNTVLEKQHSKYDEESIDELIKDYQQRVIVKEMSINKGDNIFFENEKISLKTFIKYVEKLDCTV